MRKESAMKKMCEKLMVIDNNLFRNEKFHNDLLSPWFTKGNGLLIPDVHFAEIWKSDDWRFIVSRSHKILFDNIEYVFVAHQPGGIIKRETASGIPFGESDIIDDELTQRLRQYLRNAYADTQLDLVAGQAKIFIEGQHYQHEDNKLGMLRMINAFKDMFRPILKDIRKASIEELARAACEIFKRISGDHFREYTSDELIHEQLSLSPSLTAIDLVTTYSQALLWISMDGFDSRVSEDASNDIVDRDYVVCGLCAGAFYSNDTKTKKLYDIARKACDLIWP
jgi:hypothetical protein